MKKRLLVLALSIIICSLSYGQKKKVKSVQQQANEYALKYNKLSEADKKQASIQLMNSLYRMDPRSRTVWLAALLIAENKSVVKNEKDEIMSDVNIEKGIIRIAKINMEAHFFDPKQDSLVSVQIIQKMSNKDWALKINTVLQNKIDSVKTDLTALKKERLDLKKKIPENFDINGSYDDSIYQSYERIKELEVQIPEITNDLIHYPERLLAGISNNYEKINWDDTKPSSFLVEVISNPNDGLDNLPETHYFIGEYVKGREFSIDVNKYGSVMHNSKELNIHIISNSNNNYNAESTAKKDSYKEKALKEFYGKYSYLEDLNRS